MAVAIVFGPDATERAAALGERLEALGLAVEALPAPVRLNARERRTTADAIARAARVVVLWSRGAGAGVRETARLAQRAGKLAMVRLDAARPPLRASVDLRAETPRAFAALTAAVSPRFASGRVDGTNRVEGVLIALVFVLVALTAIYIGNAPFAARVNSAAASARAAVASACSCIVR